jgi:hypothetical protein
MVRIASTVCTVVPGRKAFHFDLCYDKIGQSKLWPSGSRFWPLYAPHIEPHARDEILCKHKIYLPALWPHRLMVRTPGFHPGNRGSNPRGVTSISTIKDIVIDVFLFSMMI